MANNSLDDRLAALYQKRDHIDQFYDEDLKTIVDAIRDAREHGGTASVDITPISGGGGYTITITDSEGTEHTATVKDGGDAYEVYKSTVPEGQTPMSKANWLASLKGATPTINQTTKHWEINGSDTGVLAEGHNPNRGTYNVGDTFPSDGIAGDYIVVVDNSQSTPTAEIYKWDTSQSDWDATGVAPSDAAFDGGQLVANTAIKDLDGKNVQGEANVLSAEAGSVLAENIFNYEEIDLSGYTPLSLIINGSGKWASDAGTSVMVPVMAGEVYVIKKTGTRSANIGVLASADAPSAGDTVSFATGFSSRIVINNTTKVVTIPEDGVALYIRMTDTVGNAAPDEVLMKGGTLLEKKIADIKRYGSDTIQRLEDIPLQQYPVRSQIIATVTEGVEYRWNYTDNNSSVGTSTMIGVMPGELYRIEKNEENNSQIGLMTISEYPTRTDPLPEVGTFSAYTNGLIKLNDNNNKKVVEIVIPDDTYFMYVRLSNSDGLDMTPRITRVLPSTIMDGDDVEYGEEGIDFNRYKIDLVFSPSAQKYVNSGGASYVIPVGDGCQLQVGDTLKFLSNEVGLIKHTYANIHVSYIDTYPVEEANISTVDGVERHIFSDYIVGNKSVIPEGTKYVLIGGTYSATGVDHTPTAVYRLHKKGELTIGTFNSAFNEVDVSEERRDFCELILGKENIETFLFFTDPHLSENNRYGEITEFTRNRYISTLQKYYNSLPLDMCICGGDWLNYHDTKADAIAELGYVDGYMRKLFNNYYPVSGNHDNASYKQNNNFGDLLKPPLLPDEIRNAIFRENGNTYYEFNGEKTKCYVLDSGVSFIKEMNMSDVTYTIDYSDSYFANRWEQVYWLAQKLKDNDGEAVNSIIFMHWYANGSVENDWFNEERELKAKGIGDFGANVKEVITAYNNRSTITYNAGTANEKNYNYSTCQGKVLLIISGHTHSDYVDCSGEIPIVASTMLQSGHTPTFDCCLMDIDNSALYMTRVGNGHSRIVNCEKKEVAVGGTETLTSKLTGTLTWAVQARYNNVVVSVSSGGVVTGISAGYAGVVATDVNGREEYFIVQCS